jgi:hypothetical protein
VWVLFLAADGTVKHAREIAVSDPALVDVIGDPEAAAYGFGDGLAGLGDIDGDDVPDLAVGVPHYRPGPGAERGALFILSLDTDGGVQHARRITDESSNATTTSTTWVTLQSTTWTGGTTTITMPVVCGDAGGDGDVTASDALAALQAGVGLAECALAACDVNCSGGVSAIDALMILRAATGSLAIECQCG